MGKRIALTIVIPTRNKYCPKLKNLLDSIESQDFPKDLLEVLTVTEGTSESAKAIGIKQAQGKVIGILASDNLLIEPMFLSMMYTIAMRHGACTTSHYHHSKSYGFLDRYFALIGGNDPLSYHIGKNDRAPYGEEPTDMYYRKSFPTFGDNGFFIKKDIIMKSDMDNYYHIDNVWDVYNSMDLHDVSYAPFEIAHLTGEKFISYFKKRYSYGLQHAFNKNRRWHLVERRDLWKVVLFLISSLTVFPMLIVSVRLYLRSKDTASFMHPIMCLGIVFTYGILILKLLGHFQLPWSSARLVERKV